MPQPKKQLRSSATVHAILRQALAHHQQLQLAQAEKLYKAILRTWPKHFDALCLLGMIQRQRGKPAAALALVDDAVAIDPNHAVAWVSRGFALRDLKRHEAALASFDRALALQPDYAGALVERGNALLNLGRRQEALASFERMLELKPHEADALSDRGSLLMEIGEQGPAIDSLRAALKSDPTLISARFKLLMAHIPPHATHEDEIERSREDFSRELASLNNWLTANYTDNELEAVGAAQPFYLAYQERNNSNLLARYGILCSGLMASWQKRTGIFPQHGSPPSGAGPLAANFAPPQRKRNRGKEKIQLGIVSAQILDDSVFNAITKGWYEQLDKDRFEIHTFYLGARQDDGTAVARRHSSHFEFGIKRAEDWASLIAGKTIDILIYPEIGMDALTTQLASMRLAPLQFTTWGHPETSGLPTIDYYLSATAFENAASQNCYTEQLLQLPGLGCYSNPGNVAELTTDLGALGIRGNRPLFVCPGTPFKYAPQHDAVFVEIARRLETCQFVFFTYDMFPALSQKLLKRLSLAFEAANLDFSKHVVFVPWQEKRDFYSVMKQADVFLDTIGFSGFNTAMQAVECNLPIVTREGKFMRGRFGSAIMKALGIGELVAQNDAAYIECAIRLALNPRLRDDIRKKMQSAKDALFRDHASIRALEAILISLIGIGAASLSDRPLPHHPACGSAPGGSRS